MKILQFRFEDGPKLDLGQQLSDTLHTIYSATPSEFMSEYTIKSLKLAVSSYDFAMFFPPCATFSMMSVGTHWLKLDDQHYEPKTEKAAESLKLLKIIEQLVRVAPLWSIENPRGMFHKFWSRGIEHHVTHCQYGAQRQKPTVIFSNYSWDALSCGRGDPCHLPTPRGTRHHGTQAMKSKADRTRLPVMLRQAIIEGARHAYRTSKVHSL